MRHSMWKTSVARTCSGCLMVAGEGGWEVRDSGGRVSGDACAGARVEWGWYWGLVAVVEALLEWLCTEWR
jgi:hypothetical protein